MAYAHNLSDPTDLNGLRRYMKLSDPDLQLFPLVMQAARISDEAHLHVGAVGQQALANCFVSVIENCKVHGLEFGMTGLWTDEIIDRALAP